MRFKHALITGASSGIGTALARRLAQEHMQLTLCGRDTEMLSRLAKELTAEGAHVEVLAGNLVDEKERQILCEYIRQALPDLIVNNAGSGLYGNATALSLQKQLDVIQLNAVSVFEISVTAARAWQSQKLTGVILNVSSVAAWLPFPGFATYASSKSFVNQFSLALDAELKPFGIRILVACPGVVATAFRQRAGGQPEASEGMAMTAEYAAEQLWWQIQCGRGLHLFDWRYRCMTWIAHYVLPRSWTQRILQNSLRQLRGKDLNE